MIRQAFIETLDGLLLLRDLIATVEVRLIFICAFTPSAVRLGSWVRPSFSRYFYVAMTHYTMMLSYVLQRAKKTKTARIFLSCIEESTAVKSSQQ